MGTRRAPFAARRGPTPKASPMTEADWLAGTIISSMVQFAAEHLSTRRQRLVAAGFCRTALATFSHPDLVESLALLEQYADGLISEAGAEKARQRCRALAQQVFEEYRASKAGGEPNLRPYAQAEVAWAFAYAFNYSPVPVDEICSRVDDAATTTHAVDLHNRRHWDALSAATRSEHTARARLQQIVWDVVGNPFRPVAFLPEWRTDTVLALARQMYEAREFSAMPILADALQDAGCDSDEVLNHCRDAGGGLGEPVGGSPVLRSEHVRGCWVVDGVLGME